MSLRDHADAAKHLGLAFDQQADAAESLAKASHGSAAEHLTWIAVMLRHQANANFDAASRMIEAERALFVKEEIPA